MEIKDKIESLKYLSQIHRQQFDERRKYEWKIIFTVLTFYVLCVSAVYVQKITIKSYEWLIWLFFIILAGAVSEFLRCLHKANDKNKKIAQSAEDTISKLIGNEKTVIESPIKKPEKDDSSWTKLYNSIKTTICDWLYNLIKCDKAQRKSLKKENLKKEEDDYYWKNLLLLTKTTIWAWRWQVFVMLWFAIGASYLITNYDYPFFHLMGNKGILP